jgi:hypothetical protein
MSRRPRRSNTAAARDLGRAIRHDRAMSDDADQPSPEPSKPPTASLASRAGLIILVVLGALVALRLVRSWLKWMLIAVVIGAVVYLVKTRANPSND